jgi:hypothetical protein
VNPTLLTLARQRRGIDCGGLDYLVVAYGSFVQLVMAIDGGHLSFAIERSEVGERGPELVVALRRIRLPHQHRLVKPATAQTAAKFAHLREMERNSSSLGAAHPNAPSRSAIKPSTETLSE